MRHYTLTGADAMTHQPEHPERTARKNATGFLNFDVIFQVWPNRPSLAHTIRMQEKREARQGDWSSVIPLRETEGY
jgi:hypothetical protein